MKFKELPLEAQNEIKDAVKELCAHQKNDSYEVALHNESKLRYFYARRHQASWSDDRGNYMPFGGGSEWSVSYGRIQYMKKSMCGIPHYVAAYGQQFNKTANGVEIPTRLKTKKEVIALAKAIGLFDI